MEMFQASLDEESLEIDAIFSEVLTVVKDAWVKALEPLQERSVPRIAATVQFLLPDSHKKKKPLLHTEGLGFFLISI